MSLSEGVSNSTISGNLSPYNSTADGNRMKWGASSVMVMVILILTVLLSVPGNGAVIWVTGFKMKSKVQTVCFLNLAVTDLMYCLFLPFLMVQASQFLSDNIRNLPWVFIMPFMPLNAFASIYLLCLISIYRCLAITWPSVIWVVFIFGLPAVIMITCYAFVGWRLHGDRFVKSKKPVCLIMTAVTAFVICWLPITFYQPSPYGALNPLIYVFAGSDFRQVFRRSLFASLRLAFDEQELNGETQNRNLTSNRNI
ncbi:C3a anaphylatoxin chemotactic receptor-like [Mobula hypostoma]|uniref:C3a anaphylatoxin chemotactic receptor-like n=1 Tax=Mobula hypostoma TaxID=723540 RepID=UPI002FC28777